MTHLHIYYGLFQVLPWLVSALPPTPHPDRTGDGQQGPAGPRWDWRAGFTDQGKHKGILQIYCSQKMCFEYFEGLGHFSNCRESFSWDNHGLSPSPGRCGALPVPTSTESPSLHKATWPTWGSKLGPSLHWPHTLWSKDNRLSRSVKNTKRPLGNNKNRLAAWSFTFRKASEIFSPL